MDRRRFLVDIAWLGGGLALVAGFSRRSKTPDTPLPPSATASPLQKGVPSPQRWEAPQIWCVDGVSLTYPRSLIDEKLGSPIVARRAGDWEFHYFNGLLAWCGADIDTADEPSVLVGRHFTSRGQPMFKPNAPRSQLEEILGPPTWQSKPVLEYLDEDRKAILTLYFGDSESLRKVAISRFRLEENTYFGR